jgi:hypothetical protein
VSGPQSLVRVAVVLHFFFFARRGTSSKDQQVCSEDSVLVGPSQLGFPTLAECGPGVCLAKLSKDIGKPAQELPANTVGKKE